MKNSIQTVALAVALGTGSLSLSNCANGLVANVNSASVDPEALAQESRRALSFLYKTNPEARQLGGRAKGILVFPKITKGGFMLGGMGGNGALVAHDGGVREFYQTGGLSYGLQAGVQTYGYALFLMDNEAFKNLNASDGWEIGSSPTLVVLDQGVSGSLSTATLNSSTYAVFFNQRGLMGGLGLQGSKITRIHPPR